MPDVAASILRVSTKKQLSDGDGIENQRRGNTEYIRRKGYRLASEFVIAESADGLERADFEAVIQEVIGRRNEIKVLVFWKVDRISRGGVLPYYTLKGVLAKHGIRIEFATEQIDGSPTGELMETLLAGMARFENRLRVERTIGVERILTKDGYWCRGAPTGFQNGRLDGKPTLIPTTENGQWDLLRYGLQKQLTGAYSLRAVADELKRKGFRTSKGNPMSRQSWWNICTSPVYGGMLRGKWTDGEYVRAKFDGPLTPDQWQRLQQVLGRDAASPVAPAPRKSAHPDFPLRRFLRCPTCGRSARGYYARSRQGKKFGYYDCVEPACGFRIPADEGHDRFVSLLRHVTPAPAGISLFRGVARDVWEKLLTDRAATEEAVTVTGANLKKEKSQLIALMKRAASNPVLLGELEKDFTRVEQEISLLAVTGECREYERHDPEAVIDVCAETLGRAVELWEKWPVDAKSHLQRLVFPDGLTYV